MPPFVEEQVQVLPSQIFFAGLTFSEFAVAVVVIAAVVLFVVWLVLRFRSGWLGIDAGAPSPPDPKLTADLRALESQQRMLWEKWTEAEVKAREAEVRARESEERAKRAEAKVVALEEQVRMLRSELENNNVIDKPPSKPIVLGIWPVAPGQAPLDQQGEADAMYNAGYDYTALRGPRANRSGVILEIDRVRPNVIQVGGHGNAEGILLSDGIAEPGWWGEVVAGKGVQLMVLLSCESSQQDEVNVSDALIRVGVKAVVSCDDKIDDKDAVRFAQLLYAKLSEGLPLAKAVQRAKLAVSRKSGEMIRWREQ